MFLGFLLAVIAIKLRFLGQSLSVSWMIPLIVLGLPVFDMTLVFVSRLRRGKNPLTTPGKDHTSHRIADHGFTRREAVMMLYLACGALGMAAVLSSFSDVFASYLIAAALLAIGLFMLWFMEFGPWKLQPIQPTQLPNLPTFQPPNLPTSPTLNSSEEPINASRSSG
jgi:UDP-GlcNAc:undecaprenyl-phosphate GlcNAc-1-phosphate transferase